MSWTQGVQDASDCSEAAQKFFSKDLPDGVKFTCLVWDTTEPDIVHADYYKDGCFHSSKTFKVKK